MLLLLLLLHRIALGTLGKQKKKDTGVVHFPIFPITEWSGVLFFYLF